MSKTIEKRVSGVYDSWGLGFPSAPNFPPFGTPCELVWQEEVEPVEIKAGQEWDVDRFGHGDSRRFTVIRCNSEGGWGLVCDSPMSSGPNLWKISGIESVRGCGAIYKKFSLQKYLNEHGTLVEDVTDE